MSFIINNSLVITKKIKDIIKRDLLKSPIINYFGDNHKKNLLISYITKPFRKGTDITHTSSAEVLEIAKIYHSMGFNVDTVDYDYEGNLDYDKYEVVFGFGEPLIKSFNCNSKKIIRIYYGTGMHISVQNNNSLKRVEEVYKRKGVWLLDSGRIVEKAWSPQTNIVDAMIVLGNKEVSESYQKYFNKDIFVISPSFYKIYNYREIIEQKNFSEAKTNFLWFGGNGLIHKGLDLLLDFFKETSELHLHVCGPVDNELGFKNAFYEELYNTPNIHTYGFVKINSRTFHDLIKKCAFIIYPSCSEGGGAAVLNVCGNGGLIPVLSKETSIDTNEFGFIINSLNLEGIKNSILEVQKLNVEEMKRRSLQCGSTISKKNSLENFSNSFRECFEAVIKKYEL